MGSPRNGQTNRAVSMFEKHLNVLGINVDYIFLKEMNIRPCLGCALCLEKGEEFCPVKDDRDALVQKMASYDGFIFATPNYSLQVSGLMKIFLDRLCFVFHRPCFFHKAAIAIVTQGVYGGKDIVKYFNNVGGFWGLNVCPGEVLTTPWGAVQPKQEWPEAEVAKIDLTLKKAADRFSKTLKQKASEPSLQRVMFFRLTRTAHKYSPKRERDYEYFKNNGWLDSLYFYETKLSWYKRILGALIDKWLAKQLKKQQVTAKHIKKTDVPGSI